MKRGSDTLEVTHTTMLEAEFVAEMRRRFGDDSDHWAFQCPDCGDVATGGCFKDAIATHCPTVHRHDGMLGQECIGQIDPDRGCRFAAYGIRCGPVQVILAKGPKVWCFEIAAAGSIPGQPTDTRERADDEWYGMPDRSRI